VPERQAICTYFSEPGQANTERTLVLARERAEELGVEHVLVASTSGATGARAAQVLDGLKVVVVTHSAGFQGPNIEELQTQHRKAIEQQGATILTCQHALGGVGRAVRRKLGTYQVEEIIAFALRNFCEGTKVACEITMMAVDAGLAPASREVIAIAGTGHGADTAVVLRSANGQDFFDLRVLETICKPRCGGRT
jgi:uncharacterized protein